MGMETGEAGETSDSSASLTKWRREGAKSESILDCYVSKEFSAELLGSPWAKPGYEGVLRLSGTGLTYYV